MSASKLMQSISEDPQLEKQIGCMTGILQLFDRHQILTGRRLYGHKRISSGVAKRSTPPVNCENLSFDQTQRKLLLDSATGSKATLEPNKDTSRSSSAHNTCEPARPLPANLVGETWSKESKVHSKVSSNGRFPGKSVDGDDIGSKTTMACKKEFLRDSTDAKDSARPSLDIRDVVRISFGRELPKVSVDRKGSNLEAKTTPLGSTVSKKESPNFSVAKETIKNAGTTLKHSPTSREAPGSLSNLKYSSKPAFFSNESLPTSQHYKEPPWNSTDLNESLRLLSKLREASWNFVDIRDAPRPSLDSRDGVPRFSSSRDPARFSCDARDAHRSSSFDSKESIKGLQKMKEAPRLSLDSRLGNNPCLPHLRDEANFLAMEASRGASLLSSHPNLKVHGHSRSSGSTQKESPVDGKRYSTNVVARLMGLEEMPAISPQIKLESRGPSSEAKHIQEMLEDAKVPTDGRKNLETSIKCISQHIPPSRKTKEVENTLSSGEHWEIDELSYRKNQVLQTLFLDSTEGQIPRHTCWNHQDTVSSVPRTSGRSFFKQQVSKGILQEDESHSTTVLSEQLESTEAFYRELDKRFQQMGLRNSDQELTAFGQLLETIELLGPSTSRYPKLAGDRNQQHESTRECCLKPGSYYKQECMSTQVTNGQQGGTPADSMPRFPAHLHGKTSVMAMKSAVKHGRLQHSRRGAQKTQSYVAKPVKAVTPPNGKSETIGPTNRTNANMGRLTRPKRVLPREVVTESANALISKELAMQSTSVSVCSNGHSSIQKQINTPDNEKKVRTTGSIMKDKEESRANLVMHSLKSQSIRANISSVVGMKVAGRQNKLGSHNKSLNNVKSQSALSNRKVIKMADVLLHEGMRSNENTNRMFPPSMEHLTRQKDDLWEYEELQHEASRDNMKHGKKPLQSQPQPPPSIARTPHILTGTAAARTTSEDSAWTEDARAEPEALLLKLATAVFSGKKAEGEGINNRSTRSLNDNNGGDEATQQGESNKRDQIFDRASRFLQQHEEQQQQHLVRLQNESGALEQLAWPPAKDCYNHNYTSREGILASEQPSPVSVLDVPFQNEDDSPTKCRPQFHGGLVAVELNTDACGQSSRHWICLSNNGTPFSDDLASENARQRLINDEDCQETVAHEHADPLQGVAGVLEDAAGVIEYMISVNPALFHVLAEPEMFSLLQSGCCIVRADQCREDSGGAAEEKGSTAQCNKGEAAEFKLNRRLFFDVMDEMLRKKLYPFMIQQQEPWITCFHWPHHRRSLSSPDAAGRQLRGEELVREVWKDVGKLQPQPHPSEGLMCDTVVSLLESELLANESTNDWRHHQPLETLDVAQHIERCIFKGIVDEVIRDLLCICGRRASQPDQSTTNHPATTARRQLLYLDLS